jgi:hypothetical protein
MANLKLIKVTGSPFCSIFYGCIGIEERENQFQIIKDGRLHDQSSFSGTGWKYATAEEIEESWDAIYPHWTPEHRDNVIVTQDYGDWIGCKATIFEKDSTGTDYYRVEREDGSMSTFDYTSQMILAPYVKHYIEPEKPKEPKEPLRRFKVGDKVTYKSLAQCGGWYYFGGDDQAGFVGTIKYDGEYVEDKSCYNLKVTTKHDDFCYSMLECEFEEYDSGYVPSISLPVGSSQPTTRLVIKGSSAAADSKHILVGGVAYPIRLDSSDGSTHSTIATIDSDPLSLYKQKPITIKPKPKTKLTTI